jgi:PAS domain S-box-containing protein
MHAPLSTKNLNRIAGLLTLLLVAYAAATAWYTWADEKAEALRDMATIMEMEARAFDNYFSHLELALKGLGDDLSRDGERIDLDRAYVLVRKFHDLYPELYNVTLIQADGTVLLTARNPPRTVHVTLAGEASFIHFVDAVAQGQLFDIGRPLLAKINKVVIVPVRHAIKDRQGKLGYIVSANLTHEHLQSYWIDSPLTARAAAIGLIRDSGFLLSRYPVPADLTLDQIYGVPRTGALIHHLQQQGFPERGYVEGPSSLDGPDFLTAFRRLPTHPLTLFIAMPLSEIRAAWWRRVSSTGFALLLLFGGGFTAYRDALRRQRAWDIEDQRLKDAQQQSERRLRSIIEALPVPTVISDAQHNLTYVNAAFTTAFGYQQRELPSLAEWWVRACPDLQYRQSVLDTWYARLAGLRSHAAPSQALEVQVTTKSGERRTVLTTMSLLALPHDGSHLTTWYDITQRKAMETLLADREQHLELALAGAAMGTWEWVVPSGELRFSARWAALQGYTLEELPRRIESWATRVFPDDLPLVRERLDRHLKGETPDYESEHRLLHKNGHWVWVLARGKVVERDGAGEPVRVMGITFDITERKQTEAQLETLLREQRAILDSPVVGIVKVKARVIVWANAAFARMLGYSPEELIGQPTRIAYPNDESYEAFGQLVYPILARGEVLRTELQQRRKDGTLGWYEIGTGRLGLENGEALGAFVDISQRKSAELALRASEERLRIIFQSMAEGLVLQCRDGRIVDANPAAEALLGLGREQLLGKTSVDPQWCAFREDGTPFPGDEHPGMVTLRTGKSLRHQIMGIKAPGHGLRWISINSQPVFADEQGLPVQVIATFVDVTERRLAEAEILSTKNQLQATLDAIPDVLFEVGVDGRIHSYHSQRSDPMETSTNGFVGKTLFAVLPADAAEVCIDAIRVAVDKGGSTGHAYRLSLPQGERWFELSAAPMAAAAGQVQRVIVLSRDITERKRLEAELVAARLQAEAASVAKSRFLATMSHEIRTPMHAILGMAQMLQVPGLDERRRQDYARTVLNSGQALLALLNDILDTSKIEAGSIELESVALRPREILDDTQMLFSEAIHQKGLRFASEWSGPAAQRYLGDPYRLRQMLANLLGNAVKFTEQGRIQLAARELERDATTAVLEFSVSDTGIGIPQDKQQDLFLPFAQADTSTTRQYGGTGLGLSIVSSLAKQMHGEVGVESEVGRGSRFWFRLRARLPAAGGDGPVEARYEPSPLAARPTQMLGRVLVVDDSRSSRKVIEAMLNTLGLSVVMAENGQQAVDACLRGEAADLVLMDLHMPVMDGYDAAVRIRRWEVESAQPRHPIIALTADVKDENRQRCLTVDMDDFLCKPLVVDTLAATLGKYLPSAATASQIPAPRAVDPLRIAALLGELEVLLVEGKFDAVGCFRSLQEAVAGTELAAELTETGRLLAEVRFDLALGELRRVAAAQGWRNKT